MNTYLLPLLIGFTFAGASAFTSIYSRHWGTKGGRLATSLLRNAIGIPLFMIGLVLAWQVEENPVLPISTALAVSGWVLMAAGFLPILIGHVQLGMITHMPSAEDKLYDQGLYAYVRHPIYVGSFVFFAGLMLLHPTPPWLLACAISIFFFALMARLEEIDLLQRMPSYGEYMKQVPRFIPHQIAWLCPLGGVLAAVIVLFLWGLSWWSALVVVLMLACPINFLLGILKSKRYTDHQLKDSTACCGDTTNKVERHE